jgi:hypothetical protein
MVLGAQISLAAEMEARPYGLLMAFTALAFAGWQAATEVRPSQHTSGRFWPLAAVTAGLAGAILSHHFGLVHAGFFLAVGETVRLVRRRRIDSPMLAAVALGMTPLFLTVPLARQSSLILGEAVRQSTIFWARPTLGDFSAYGTMIPPLLFGIAAAAALLVLPGLRERETGPPEARSKTGTASIAAHEWAAAVALALIVPVQLALAAAVTNYFREKYAISTALGLAIVAAWGLPRIGSLRRFAEPVFAAAVAVFLIIGAARLIHAEFKVPAGTSNAARALSPLLLDAPPGTPIVVSNAYDFTAQWWYADAQTRTRLVCLSDIPYATRQPDFLPELSLVLDRDVLPLPVADYHPFILSHDSFLLLSIGRARVNWLPQRLAAAGWRFQPLARDGTDVLYRVQRPKLVHATAAAG